jgi:RNA recognition motif-containing protein
MGTRVFLGNLAWSATSDSLAKVLKDEGYACRSVDVITDHDSGRSRGFAFVEFETPEAAEEAVVELEGFQVDGRPLRPAIAEEKKNRRDRNDSRGSRRRDEW